ncbi:hypothetical protein FRC01_012057 [Tulasnella sp. 417]|nr:hypothetical protein FRC01_012057 [Tulasnella sp. 417]
MATPLYRIPAEVFEEIFKAMIEGGEALDNARTLMKLMGVCRHWHATILNCPRLWTRLDSDLPPEIAALIIERSRGLPILSLRWEADGRDHSNTDTAVLHMVTQNSRQLKSMYFQMWPGDLSNIWSLLESTTTALESLTIYMGSHCHEVVTLSDGVPLKHLFLKDVTLDFATPRLSGLVSLHLFGSAAPSLAKTLIQILEAAAAQLEELAISWTRGLTEYRQSSSITLPRLKNLKLENIPPSYSTALIATIYAPACSYIRVKESAHRKHDPTQTLDAVIWKPGNTQTAALLGLESRSDPRTIQISILVFLMAVRIDVDEEGYRRGDLFLLSEEPWRMVRLMREYFFHHPSSFSISLNITDATFKDDPLDLIPWSRHLQELILVYFDDCLRALEQLGQRATAPSWSGVETREDWVCPNLRSIMLHIPKKEEDCALHVAALRSLVQKRWSSADSEFAPANQPTKFDITCTTSIYEELQTVEAEIREIVPCFMFRTKG